MIGRRQVFYVAGFDPIDAPAQHRRFRREAEKFGRIWNISTEVFDMDAQAAAEAGRWKAVACGPNWTTETDFELLDWQDIVRKEIARPAIAHLVEGMIAFADFLFSGTAARYFRAAWPYGTFFAAPFLNVLLFTALAIGAGVGAAEALAKYGVAIAAGAGVAVACAVFLVLMSTLGRRWRVRQALADWVFAREFMYGRRPEMKARLEAFAQRIVAAAAKGSHDEIVIVGHSLGATMAMLALTRALDLDGNLTQHGRKISLLTIGSTIPKLALHPAAGALRDCGTRVASEPEIAWTEFQARRDVISFYKFDPVTLERFLGNVAGRKPHIRLIGMKDLLTTETYNRNWLRQMRLHYQFVMANERRAQYDYFMFVCGPVAFSQLSEAPDGPLDLFGADGSLLASAERAP
ncbi:MAG: lipase family protein [Xanthobacteraceae bacterium]